MTHFPSIGLAIGLGFGLAAGLVTGLVAPARAEAGCQTATSQVEMVDCARSVYEAEDKRLNTVYKQAMALMRQWDSGLSKELAGGPDALREAQRAWLVYRDAGCKAEGFAMRGGSNEPLLVYGCLARVTAERSAALADLLEYGEH